MAASSNAVRSVEHQPNLNEVPPTSAAYVIDFFETRHRLLTESERIAQESEIDRQIQEPAIRRERSVGLVDALEEAFYWLILAAAPHIWPLGSSAFETLLCVRAPRQLMQLTTKRRQPEPENRRLKQNGLTVNEQIAGTSVNPSARLSIQDLMPLLTNYDSMKMSINIDQFLYVEKLATLTQLYLELRLPLHDALRAAEADL
jgi:hypothetical protein